MGFLQRISRAVHRSPPEEPAKSLHHEPFYKFDLSEDFYLRYRCKVCDDTKESNDDTLFTECKCGGTDIWLTRGKKWALSHEQEFWERFDTTDDIKVPKEARKWLVGQEKAMERELMEVRRWIYKKRQQQDEMRNAPVVRLKDLEATLGQKPRDRGMIDLDKKTYRVHFLDETWAILEPGNFMKENPGPYILRISQPGLGKTLAKKILREEAEPMYKEAGIELTDVLTMANPTDEQRPLVRLVPCHAVQGGGCLAPRIVAQAERTEITQDKEKQQFMYSLLMIVLLFGAGIMFTGLFIMGLVVMQVGIVAAWFQYMSAYIGLIAFGASMLFLPMFIFFLAGAFFNRTGGKQGDKLMTPYPIVQHDDRPKYLYDATVTDSATLMGSIQWNAYGNTPGLTNPLYKRVIAGLVHRAHDMIGDVDEIRNMSHMTAIEMLSVMEDGESLIRNRGGSNNSEASGILAISTADPVPADFMLICNGNMDMIHDPNSILNIIKAFFDRFNYGDAIYYESHIDATFENQLKIVQVVTDEISRFRLYPMKRDGIKHIIEYMRDRSDNNQRYKIMFRYVIKVVLKGFEVALMRGETVIQGDHVSEAITKYCDTVPEQEQKELLINSAPFKIVQSQGTEFGRINGLAVVGGSAGKAFPVAAETFPVKDHNYGDFVVTGEDKHEESWVQDSIKNVRTVIRKLYGIDIKKDHYTHVSFAQQKDVEGPSAGVAMTLTIMSRLGDPRLAAPHEGDCPVDESGKSKHLDAKGKPRHREPVPLRQDTAVTGTIEILPHADPMNVRVGAIGGVAYKVQGAADAGCKYVVIPQENFEHTLTSAKYPCVIFGADSILGFFDLLRADQHNIEALLEYKTTKSPEDLEKWSAEKARHKPGAIKSEAEEASQ